MKLNYPIKFTPILKERIWGGNKLHLLFNKEKSQKPIGESWEIAALPEGVSVVANGHFKGQNLQELISTYTHELLGDEVYEKYGETFPLLIKFIDAENDLSVQLHPDDSLAQVRHQSFGKEELWYIMQAEKNSKLYLGFEGKVNQEIYLEYLNKGRLPEILHQEKVKKGSVYHIPPGRVHAIGGGIVLAEIQQSSDITYRLYDWDRTQPDGSTRALHTDFALDAINFTSIENYETYYTAKSNAFRDIIKTDYFVVKILKLKTKKTFLTSSSDSFVIYMCVGGSGFINVELMQVPIALGETVLIPASLKKYSITPDASLKLLYVKAK